MAENSGIAWTHHTMNWWWGCHKVSAECTHCYIDGIMRRAGQVPFNGPMRTVDWSKPYKWERQAQNQIRFGFTFNKYHPLRKEKLPSGHVQVTLQIIDIG